MRKFTRPLIICPACGARIYNWISVPESYQNTVPANWTEPPKPTENCPKCGTPVDTTTAYPFIPNFPAKFDPLKNAYNGFSPQWEHNRYSFEHLVQKFLSKATIADCEAALNSPEGFQWYRQRMFYRSATAFYRSLQLFLAYLTLDGQCYVSWSAVTAYYSRFYFIQAFLNLLLSTYLNLGRTARSLIFFDGNKIVCVEQKNLPEMLRRSSSHDMWWDLMEALKSPGYPCENLDFILSKLVFNPEQRQTVNYDYEYLGGGFIELDWFDQGAKQMLSHFMPHPRADRDITQIDRFFAGHNPENVDPSDFYGDQAQIVWCSLIGYLQLLRALEFKQHFVLTETIGALSELHIGQRYPRIFQGLVRSTAECLQDGFDLDSFMQHYESQNPEPFFKSY
jgi:hypothetical protein